MIASHNAEDVAPHSVGKAGFTIVELSIVMAFFGILTFISLPKLAGAVRQRAVANAGNEFVLTHSLARATALRYGRVAQLHIDAAAARLWVDVDTSGTGVRDTIGGVHLLSETGRVQVSSTRSVLCFDARGFATTNATCAGGDVTVVFSSLSWADTVRTTTLGKVLR